MNTLLAIVVALECVIVTCLLIAAFNFMGAFDD